MRFGLYARVSTSIQDVGMQLDELRQVARQRGWVIAGEYLDEGVSGTKDHRPALDRMMAAARAGKLDGIAVWRLDRFARSTTFLLQALEELRILGVALVSIREQIDFSTPIGKVLYTLIAAIAQLERDVIRERVIAGIARARAKGKRLGRKPREIDIDRVMRLRAEGRSLRSVSMALRVPRSTLRGILARSAGEKYQGRISDHQGDEGQGGEP